MCGVVGIVDANEVDAKLRSAVQALHHRGPDGKAVWKSSDNRTGLAHARLSIIGINNGTQPISNETEDVHIVVNGELYDFERIRSELIAKGHRFRTDSDSEIALHLYEEYGFDCVHHLRGEFALIIWDERKKLLFAARDRFGIKPLVYAKHEGSLILASEAKALFAAGVPAKWDTESFFHSANMQYVLPHRTLFEGIFQLQPGHMLVAKNGRVDISCYWDLDYILADDHRGGGAPVGATGSEATLARSVPGRRENEAIEEFRHQLSEAVRLRLRSDIPVSCHLSGGLDSSAVLALAMEHHNGPIKCFSVSFEEESYDEFEAASEMARFAGGDFHPIHISQKDLIENLADAVYYTEGLAVNGHLTAKYLLNREIRKNGYKVALTGEGSDEVVAGYPHLRSDLFREEGRTELLAGLHASNKASAGIMLQHGDSLPLNAVQAKLSYVPSFLEAKGTLGHKVSSVLDDGFRKQFAGRDCYEQLLDCFNVESQLRGRDHVNQSLYLWSKTALANYILKTLGDGCEMAHSVEGRLPFLDHKVFEFVRRLPTSLKIKGTTEKFILREAVREKITKTIYSRQKHPFVAPPVSRFSKGAEEMVQDAVRSKAFDSLPFFDKKRVQHLLDSLPKMEADARAATDPVIMTVLSAVALQDRYALRT